MIKMVIQELVVSIILVTGEYTQPSRNTTV